MIAIIDTDALLGLANPDDGLHERAKSVLDGLEKKGFEILISPTTLCEFEIIATIRLGKEQTIQAIKQIIRTAYSIVSLPDQW